MLREFKDIIKEMDLNLTEYSQKRIYEEKLSDLNKKYENKNNFKEITYELNSLSFLIKSGELMPSKKYDKYCYSDRDNNYGNYLKQRFDDTPNAILKNMYLIIILNLNLNHEEVRVFINKSLKLLNDYLIKEDNVDLDNDLLIATFDKCMSFNYKQDEIKSLIVKYVKAEFNDALNIKRLIELMLSKKKVFKKDDFEGIDDICWKCAQESETITIIEFLKLGQKISQKINSNKYNWFNEIGKTYERFAEERGDSKLIQLTHLTHAIEYYNQGNNPKKVEEISIKLKKTQNEYAPSEIHLECDLNEVLNEIMIEIFKMPLNSNNLFEFLIHGKKDFLIPKLEKGDENYKKFIKNSPILGMSSRLILDNNYNINQILNGDNLEEAIMDTNYEQYSFLIVFCNIFLKKMFVYMYNLEIFTYDSVIDYLSNCQKFLNISDGEKPLLYYFKPIMREYFKQLELCLSNEENNYALFIDAIVPKLEYLIRKLCDIYDINMLKTQRNGTTSERLLHDFFNDSKFKEVLLERDYDFLKYVLLNPGLNLRNKATHGFDLKIYTLDNANLLLLCFFRLLKYFIIIDNEYF